MRQYNDRMEMGEPEPIESFLPNPRDIPLMEPMPVMDEPKFTTMPIGPRGPGMSIEDMLEGRVTTMPVEEPVRTTMPVPVGPLTTRIRIEDMLEDRLTNLPVPVGFDRSRPSYLAGLAPERKNPLEDMIASGSLPKAAMPELPDFSNMPIPEPTPEPIYTPPPMVPNIPKIPNIDLSNLPKFDSQTTSGRPMIPNFGNINLR